MVFVSAKTGFQASDIDDTLPHPGTENAVTLPPQGSENDVTLPPQGSENQVSLETSEVSLKTTDLKPGEDKVMQHFHHWDVDGSGRISEDELRHILLQLGMCAKDVHKIFVMADTNGDGVLDYGEFVRWAFGSGNKYLKQVELQDHHLSHETQDLHPDWKPTMLNLKKRFPNVDDKVIREALEQAEGHGGTAVKLLKQRGEKASTSVLDSLTAKERKLVSELARRFPDASHVDISQALVQSEGHIGIACGILRSHPSAAAIKNLLRRFPDASEAEVLDALAEMGDHAGKAALVLHHRMSVGRLSLCGTGTNRGDGRASTAPAGVHGRLSTQSSAPESVTAYESSHRESIHNIHGEDGEGSTSLQSSQIHHSKDIHHRVGGVALEEFDERIFCGTVHY